MTQPGRKSLQGSGEELRLAVFRLYVLILVPALLRPVARAVDRGLCRLGHLRHSHRSSN